MALDTYANLQTAIISYAFRTGDSEFTAAVPDFITLTESRLNRELRTGDMEDEATITLTDGAGTLPADFLQVRRLMSGNTSVQAASPNFAEATYAYANSGVPEVYTIIGATLKTYPPGSADLTLNYYAKIPALSGSNTTNWLLAKAPELYLYGALVEAAPFMMDDARTQVWGTLFQKALADLKRADKGARYSRATACVSGPTP
jgi:hypothetical protein